MDFDRRNIKLVFEKKLGVKSVAYEGPGWIFPADLKETLRP
jgi:hypothetical protein